MKNLFLQAILKFLLGVLMVGALIFLPAGTLNFPAGWLLMGILFVPMFAAGIVMLCKDPNLLRSRLDADSDSREVKKAIDALLRRGHSYGTIRRALNGLNFEAEEFPEE